MRIGIDCRTILNPKGGERAGVGHYTYYLVKSLLKLDKKNEYILFMDHTAKNLQAEFTGKNVQVKFFKFSEYKRYLPFAYSHVLTASEIKKHKLDIFHAPANVIPLNYSGKSVVTIHDMAIYKHPEWFPAGQKLAINVLVPSSIKRAKRVIAVSNSTKKSILEKSKINPEKIKVIYEAGVTERQPTLKEQQQVLKHFGLKENFIFYVGTLEVRKNLVRLIKAWEKVWEESPQKFENWQLVLAGQKGFGFQEVYKTIKNSKICHKIRYIGYVTHVEKVALLKAASVFAFPSLWEGFGIPVLEAMQFGVPVLTSKISSLPEVAGKAAVLIDPMKINSIASGLDKLIKTKATKTKFSKLGREQVKKFSWAQVARETLQIYKSVAE